MELPEDLALKPANEFTTDNVHLDEETNTFQFDDAAALKLVIDDATIGDNFMNVNQWAAMWTLADTLLQSPASSSAFDGGGPTQANVPKFTLSNHISSIVPRLIGGIFYEDPPFLMRPYPGTTQDIVEWKTAVTSAQLNEMRFEEESERFLDQMALLGTGMMKWGYTEYHKTERKYVRKSKPQSVNTPSGPIEVDTQESDDFVATPVDKLISHPWIKYCDIRTVLVDPGCRIGDIRHAKWAIYRDYATYEDLDRLRGVEGYDIPDEETLRSFFLRPAGEQASDSTKGDNITLTMPEGMRGWLQHALPRNFKTSHDPMQFGLQLLERWDKDKVIVVLNFNETNILIRNEPNPYGKLPFYSANWRNLPDTFYGQGLGLLIGSEQLVEQGITNLALDLLAYGLQPTAVRKKGFNVSTQATRWKQGGIIDVDEDVDKAFKFLQMPPVPAEAWTFVQQSKADSAATSGANEQVIQGAGAQGVKTTGMRSGTGAAAVVQANASRLDGPDGRFIRQVFVPWLYQLDELNANYLPTSVMRDILGEQLGVQAAKAFDHIKYRNGRVKYQVLAGAHLGAKKEMQQAMPFIISLMNNPTFAESCKEAGWIFDGPAIFKAFSDAAGWTFSQPFLRQMSDEEKKQAQANSPAALNASKIQAQEAAQGQQFRQKQQLIDQQQLGRSADQVMRVAMEQQTREGLNGE